MNSTDRQDRTRARLLAARQDLLNRLRAQRGGIVSRADAAAEQLAAEREESHAQAITERDTAFALDAHETAELAALESRLDTLIAEAVGRKQPILFYYWQPNAILAQFVFKPVAMPAFDPDAFKCAGQGACAGLKPTGFSPDPVVVGLAEWVYMEAPQVAAYFGRARMPVAEMDKLLLELGEPGATVETIADRFVALRQDIWQPWVGQSLQPLSSR